MKSNAYSEGWLAYAWNCASNVTQQTNPYTAPSDEYFEWERGYNEARNKDEETGHL